MASRRVIKASKNVLDSMFFIPDGVEDTEYAKDGTGLAGDTLEDDEGTVVIEGPQPAPPSDTKPKTNKPSPTPKPKTKGRNGGDGGKVGTPKTFKVVSQKITTRPDGSQFVDIAVEIDKVANATGYEFRVTATATGKTTVYEG